MEEKVTLNEEVPETPTYDIELDVVDFMPEEVSAPEK